MTARGSGEVSDGTPDIAGLLSPLSGEQPRMEEMLGRFVRIESPTDDPEATARMGDEAVSALTDGAPGLLNGASVSRVSGTHAGRPRGPHVLVRVPGAAPAEKPLLLLGHLDTVWAHGTLNEIPFQIEDGVARGPGVYDMKAGLVQTIWALRALDRRGLRPRRPLTILWNSDEEAGSAASREFIEAESAAAAACLVMEPSLPGGGAKTARRGVGILSVRVRGRAAHAGLDPERGINAITELAGIVTAAAALSAPEQGVTVNVGLIRGGSRTNVVPAEASADVDIRMDDPESGERLIRALRGLGARHPEAEVDWTGGVNRPALVRNEGVVTLYERARRLAGEIGWELGEGSAGGGSDGNIVAGLGVPVLDGLGPLGDGAHARHEQVVTADLPRRAALLAALLLGL